MADLIDVMNGLTAVCTTTLYPNGIGSPTAASPVNSVQTRIFPGWPSTSQLDTDLAAGIVTVAVFTGQVEKNTTRFLGDWQQNGVITAGSAEMVREIRRTRREFQVHVWAPTPALRDTTAAALDLAIVGLEGRMTLADGSMAWVQYVRSVVDDVPQKELMYYRSLAYAIEYGTFQSQQATVVTDAVTNLTGGNVPNVAIKTITVTE